MTFQAFAIGGDRDLAIHVPASPAGPLNLRSWFAHEKTDGAPAVTLRGGSAVILPIQPAMIEWTGGRAYLGLGCFALAPAGARIFGGAGVIIHTPHYRGLRQFGGPVEAGGRLRYIDGCSDSLLICPALLGDPCLNHLHLPAGTAQTAHTHPSDRVGIILRGRGECRTPEGTAALLPGMFWYIPTGTVHSFHTADDSLDVIAWHPDSDFGPSHDSHPMVNRTIVDGVAANDERLRAIRTGALEQPAEA